MSKLGSMEARTVLDLEKAKVVRYTSEMDVGSSQLHKVDGKLQGPHCTEDSGR